MHISIPVVDNLILIPLIIYAQLKNSVENYPQA